MEQGIIQEFYATTRGAKKSVVKFFVENEGLERDNNCILYAEIPNDALMYDMVKTGSSIRCEDQKVFLEIEGVEDVAFKQISNSVFDDASFETSNSVNALEEKGFNGL